MDKGLYGDPGFLNLINLFTRNVKFVHIVIKRRLSVEFISFYLRNGGGFGLLLSFLGKEGY